MVKDIEEEIGRDHELDLDELLEKGLDEMKNAARLFESNATQKEAFESYKLAITILRKIDREDEN